MGVYLYCVVPPGAVPSEELCGLDGAPVRTLPMDGFDAWVGTLATRPAPSIERVKVHNAVVADALGPDVTPIPFRFGHWRADDGALRAELADERDRLRAGLALVEGAVEYGVRALDPGRSEPAPAAAAGGPVTGGRAYLEQVRRRLGAREDAEATAAAVEAALAGLVGPLVRATRAEVMASAHGIATVAHLVPRAAESSYAEAVRGVRETFPALRFLFSGPWPPYSFGA